MDRDQVMKDAGTAFISSHGLPWTVFNAENDARAYIRFDTPDGPYQIDFDRGSGIRTQREWEALIERAFSMSGRGTPAVLKYKFPQRYRGAAAA